MRTLSDCHPEVYLDITQAGASKTAFRQNAPNFFKSGSVVENVTVQTPFMQNLAVGAPKLIFHCEIFNNQIRIFEKPSFYLERRN
jgi:uncharacterized Zn-finger protein